MKKIALNLLFISSILIHNSVYAGAMGNINLAPEWTGFYGGLNLGYTDSYSKIVNVTVKTIQSLSAPGTGGAPQVLAAASLTSGSGSVSLNSNGFIGGGQIGYVRSMYSKFVAGLEADIQGIANGNEQKTLSQTGILVAIPNMQIEIPSSTTVSKGIDYLGTLRGRLSYCYLRLVLIYLLYLRAPQFSLMM